MSAKLIEKLILIFFITIITNSVKSDENTINVRIKNGLINGNRETVDNSELNVFLGIPYAEPPVGPLRFKKPLPKQPWVEPVNANQWPDACYQSVENKDYTRDKKESEDCLYLNIWSPVNNTALAGELKPVMFWIYGGALIVGSSLMSYYSGHVLAAKGDVVVVTINYRLNTFGFLYTGTDDAPGNMGLWDQALALEWVNDNIQYFGGDPNRITIFGESAGGWSTSLHILSPVSRHLFQNAILMSGSAINNQAGEEPEVILKNWLIGAEAVGCSDDENNEQKTKFTPKVIECLQNTSPERIASIPFLPAITTGLIGWMSLVVVDQQFLPNRPLEMLRSGDFKKNLNLLVGTVEDEGSFVLGDSVDDIKYNRFSPQNITFSDAYTELSRISEMLYSKEPIDGKDVSKLYFTTLSDQNSADLLRRTIGIAIGDFLLTCPTLQFAKELFENDRKSRVFQYYYNTKLGESKFLCSPWMGACHFDDVYPVFGVPFFEFENFVDREREISTEMIKIFTDFAKTGKPLTQTGEEWPQYYSLNDQIISPYFEITTKPKLNSNFGIGLKINECEYLWQKYIT